MVQLNERENEKCNVNEMAGSFSTYRIRKNQDGIKRNNETK